MPEKLLFAISKKFDDALTIMDDSADSFKRSESSSVFKETNTTIAASLIKECASKLSPELKLTAAYQTLERSLIEFANNSEQAHATQITLACHLNTDANQIRFVIHDNGHGLTPDYITARYDWEAALQKRSTQASAEEDTVKKASGQHLGVSTAAYLLERKGGNLALENNKDGTGARVTVTSPLEKYDTALFDQPSDEETLKINKISPDNIVEEMVHCLVKKQPIESEQIAILGQIAKTSASSTLKNAARAAKQRLQTSPLDVCTLVGSVSFTTSPIITPTSSTTQKKGRPPSLLTLTGSNSSGMFSPPPAIREIEAKASEPPTITLELKSPRQ